MSVPSPISERALERLLASREQFVSFVKKRVTSPEPAEDLVQSAFIKALEHGGDVRSEESVVAWFYRVLRNSVSDYYRHTGTDKLEFTDSLPEKGSLARSELPHNEICECLNPLLDNLKAEYREAIRVVDLGEAPLADLAACAGITESNAAVRVHRARQAMKKQVESACGACAEHHCINCDCKHG